jgi:RimJ/RimL family protein N-acetyltransferase
MSTIPCLKGNRVLLGLFQPSDITPEYLGWLNDPQVVRYSNQRLHQHSAETCKKYLSSFEGTNNWFLKIVDSLDGLTVGTMTAYASAHHGTVDLGILIGRREVWGQGLGQDAWNTLMGWFLEKAKLRKVTGGAMRANVAMVRIMEKSGMNLEAVRGGQELLEGKPQDLLYYAKFHASH